MARLEHDDADHQRPRGRDPHDGGDPEATGRGRDARGRRDRDPPDHEHGPRDRPSRERRRGRNRAASRDQDLARIGRARDPDLLSEPKKPSMGTARKRAPKPAATPPDPTTPKLEPVVAKAATAASAAL